MSHTDARCNNDIRSQSNQVCLSNFSGVYLLVLSHLLVFKCIFSEQRTVLISHSNGPAFFLVLVLPEALNRACCELEYKAWVPSFFHLTFSFIFSDLRKLLLAPANTWACFDLFIPTVRVLFMSLLEALKSANKVSHFHSHASF